MNETITESKASLSDKAPQAVVLQIDKSKIRDLIGKGGDTIRALTSETETLIDVDDNGRVTIYGDNAKSRELAVQRVEEVTASPEVNKIYDGKVAKITDFGAFVTILPNTDGLVHISEISEERVEKVTDVLTEGETISVKVLEVDSRGKIRLTMKGIEK
jgi:polyribonucleotide nucleotidyltransferase